MSDPAPVAARPVPERSDTTTTTSTDSGSDTPTTVYGLIHGLAATVVDAIDAPLDWDALLSPSVSYTVIRPIVQRFAPKFGGKEEDAGPSLGAVLFALMANRIQFLRLVEEDLSQSALQTTRAEFCELLAIKVLRTWPSTRGEEELTAELVRLWGALDGAPDDVRDAVDADDLTSARDSALELAIVSAAKRFLAQPLIQHLCNAVYVGEIVYQPQTHNSLIADNYVSPKTKHRRQKLRNRDGAAADFLQDDDPDQPEVYSYDPYVAGWLDYTRLRVPRWRDWIEFGSFSLLLALFIVTLSTRDLQALSGVEVVFIIYTFGVLLDEFAAARENGWLVYIANTWNIFDLSFSAVFLTYLIIRIISLARHSAVMADYAFDVLSLGSCILFPRLVFFLINNSVVILALRGMISTYINFMILTAVAFSGIWFCLWELGRPNGKSMMDVVKLLAKIWFGTGSWTEGDKYHPTFGQPILFVYSALCKTFLITIMMSMISQKYSRVYANAQQENLFQRVVATLEGVKSDSVFSYLPGFNLFALAALVPLSAIVTPEQLHRVNVFLIRVSNLPVLFLISAYERWHYRTTRHRIRLTERGQVQAKSGGLMDSFLGSNSEVLIHAAFDVAPPTPAAALPAIAAAAATDPEAAGAAAQPDTAAAGKKQRDKPSALGKLFNKNDRNAAPTVTITAAEWDEVRASQKRLEEMLAKIAAVSGV